MHRNINLGIVIGVLILIVTIVIILRKEEQFSEKYNTLRSKDVPKNVIGGLDKHSSNADRTTNSIVPTSFDCRTKWSGKIGDVLYEGTCGSCWALSTSTAFADRIRIHSRLGKSNVKLSLNSGKWLEYLSENREDPKSVQYKIGGQYVTATEQNFRNATNLLTKNIPYFETVADQQSGNVREIKNTISPNYIVACDVDGISSKLESTAYKFIKDNDLLGFGCAGGGIVQYAHIYLILNGGISLGCDKDPLHYTCDTSTDCFLYKAARCYRVNLHDHDDLKSASQEKLDENVQAIQKEIMNFGPVVASFDVYENFEKIEQGFIPGTTVYGIVDKVNKGGHSVCIVGWGEEHDSNGNVVPYFICRNSWSNTWNGDGYFKFLRGKNFLGIEEDCWAAMPLKVYDVKKIGSKN